MNPFDPGYYTSEQLRMFGFARVGERCSIARNCTILGLENITIGDDVRIDGYATLIATGGRLRIGDHVHICSGCVVGARGGVEFGPFSSLSHGVRVLSAIDDFSGERMTNSTLPREVLGVTAAPIRIQAYVPIGTNAILLPGTDIGEGAAVHATSIVAGVLPPWTICGGSPAKPLAARSRNLLSHAERLAAAQEGRSSR